MPWGNWIKQAFDHADGGGHLVRGKVLDQFVGVLFVCRHNKAILNRDIAESGRPCIVTFRGQHCASQIGPPLKALV